MDNLSPISVLVRNERGVLSRVSGLFARRGFNIYSLAVGETDDPKVSRISVVVAGDPPVIDQVVKQLRRLVSVIKVSDLTGRPRVERGLLMIKVNAPHDKRGELLQLVQIFRARVDHVDNQGLILEVTGNREKLEAFIDLLRPHGIQEMARTGQIAMARSQGPMADYWSESASGYDMEEEGTYNISRAAERLAQEIDKQD
ncbi:MAG: acetolactate synthase small subunit [Desulfarculaceae bacterium]|nr:acetolactate synthase small subunit [Desulfarculaceae bacterium]MCF8047539.1 acetolactate synthase small subunit [Desulfarculaceae bacterium]MCF8064071.1 acetolactate synthase small subunit [Desulfarculaceae bacterium]MCF8096602.1 acetolactate synthase small subunit [Desulfarculaceae bacterium]MCF8122260.1 acetolactate synthase small subunit [Desulfarculaceae bacterium]